MLLKRAFDIIVSTFALIVLSPLLITIALTVKLTSEGPILYPATRVGMNGKSIKVYKFRTMVMNADKIGGSVTIKNDPRVTPIGRLLRKYKLDELAQLFNVWNGTMSFVGPRPEHPYYVGMYTAEQQEILRVRPGITSPASLKYRNEEELLSGKDTESYYVTTLMPEKLAIDIEYIQTSNLYTDILIILKTLWIVVSK
jgi:lipopolysaccharide/colanic/teichoic acid biosynthesis glycosyltransferase